MDIDSLVCKWKISDQQDFYICNECFNHFESLDISNFFEEIGIGSWWRYKNSKEEYKQNKLFDPFRKDNLEPVPIPT